MIRVYIACPHCSNSISVRVESWMVDERTDVDCGQCGAEIQVDTSVEVEVMDWTLAPETTEEPTG